jgi:cardiolipin synthase
MIPLEYKKNIQLLVDGKLAFEKIVERIQRAKRSIHITSFIWRDDSVGNLIGAELLKAADRGVKVDIIKDKFGAIYEKAEENKQSLFHKHNNFGFWVQQKCIDRFYYAPQKPKSAKQKHSELARALRQHRNITLQDQKVRKDHTKYFIFDDRYVITGGMNIEDKAVYQDVRGRLWNDYMVHLEGEPFVRKLRSRLQGAARETDAWFGFVLNTKDKVRAFEMKSVILDLLGSAQKSIFIQMAYCGDKDITARLIENANNGTEVTIILPKSSNLQNDYNFKVMREIWIKTGNKANIYLCKNMMHAKVLEIDRQRVLLGSANLNRLSMDRLSELNVLVQEHRALIDRLKKSAGDHIKNSKKVEGLDQLRYNRLRAFIESWLC